MYHDKQIHFGPRDGSRYVMTLAPFDRSIGYVEHVVGYVEQHHRGPWIAYAFTTAGPSVEIGHGTTRKAAVHRFVNWLNGVL